MRRPSRTRLHLVRCIPQCAVIVLLATSVFWSSAAVGDSLEKNGGASNSFFAFLPAIVAPFSSGSISAIPNPVKVCDGTGLGSVKLFWSSSGATTVEVHLGSPTGALIASGFSGSFTTTKSVSNGTVFYLQDVTSKSSTTLATVTVGVTTAGCTPPGNQAPVAVHGGPYSGIAGTAVQFNGGGSFDPDGSIVSYQWNFGDGTPFGAGVAPTHVYVSAANYTVTLTVTDNSGATNSASTNAAISGPPPPGNQPPVAVTGGPYSGTAGTAVQFNGGSSFDPDGNIASYQWNFGDGTPFGTGVAPTHVYPSAADYTVTLTVTDNAGATSSASTTASINPVPPPPTSSFSSAMVDPENRTGGSGEDLFSGNYNWSLPLVGLTGRAGLDLELSLTYNSMVWTRSGSSIKFDPDNGFPAPGFRLGFPVIQAQTYTSQAGVSAYLIIMSSGSRVELRSVGGGLFESADSSYIQFIPGINIVRTPDGSVLTYEQIGVTLMCKEIRDRNGNKITINNSGGRINTITDTLGRVIRFNYSNGTLSSITQDGTLGTWAQFSYQPFSPQPNFAGLQGIAPSSVSALASVSLADGSSYSFDYTAIGQVSTFHRRAPDGHERANTSFLTNNSTSDCPRVTQRTDFAENWMTVATSYPTIGAISAGKGKVNLPDGTSVEEDYPTAGFSKGLPIQSKIISGGITKKTTTTSWTQDNTTLTFPANPRVIETRISDDTGNLRKTSFAHTIFNLISDVTEYDAGGLTPLRKTHTDYINFDTPGKGRIIGLPSLTTVSDGANTLFSKTQYSYDSSVQFQGEPVQHDSTYGAGFTAGRGNLTIVNRFDVGTNTPTQVQTINYNTAGSPILIRDAIRTVLTIGYLDAFSDGFNRNTLAYPTTMTDGDGFSSTMTYQYDLGVATKTHDPKGAEQLMEYNDVAGRLTRRTYFDSVNRINGTHTRLEYPLSGNEVRTYTLLDSGAAESFSGQVFDGAGRLLGTVRNLPGSTGGYSAQKMIYDAMGRPRQQSNPAEISYFTGQSITTWTPTGDDLAWAFITQDYDWNGRPTITRNTDGSTKSAVYGGCGCAGGEVVTLTDEVGRKQKVYHDVLGRLVKTELYSDAVTVYATTTNTYNVRDQVTRVRQHKGLDTSGVFQDTTMTYDGHARLRTQHRPAQDAGKATIYDYYPDDSILTVTDGRGASTTFTYNNRHLVTAISHNDVAPTPNVSFAYDEAGNRSSMTDGAGSCTYQYDTWSRMTSETRQFTGLSAKTLNYTYSLAGQLKSITDPFNDTINYAIDQAGQLSAVTGTSFGGVTQYASAIKYRAWGGLKQLSYGNTLQLSVNYNLRLQPNFFRIPFLMNKRYEYYSDGMLKNSTDIIDPRFDRSYVYDSQGRIFKARSGLEARTNQQTNDRPYRENFIFDEFNHLTERPTNLHWSSALPNLTATYVNDRNTQWQYDADGNVVLLFSPVEHIQYSRDAASRPTRIVASTDTTVTYDGNGQKVKSVEVNSITGTTTLFHVRSSVLGGQVISELTEQGNKRRTFVYAGSSLMATQWADGFPLVEWEHRDPSNASFRVTDRFGNNTPSHEESDPAELDPAGANMETSDPYLVFEPPPETEESLTAYPNHGNPRNPAIRYTWNGIAIDLDTFMMLHNSTGAVLAPPQTSQWNAKQNKFEFWHAYGDGTSGWSPMGAASNGHGFSYPSTTLVLGDRYEKKESSNYRWPEDFHQNAAGEWVLNGPDDPEPPVNVSGNSQERIIVVNQSGELLRVLREMLRSDPTHKQRVEQARKKEFFRTYQQPRLRQALAVYMDCLFVPTLKQGATNLSGILGLGASIGSIGTGTTLGVVAGVAGLYPSIQMFESGKTTFDKEAADCDKQFERASNRIWWTPHWGRKW